MMNCWIMIQYRGRRQGVCWGGGGAKCLATAARAPKFCASPEKVAQWGGGGDSDTFFPTSNNFPRKWGRRIIIMAMTDRWADKQKKNIIINCAIAPMPPPPPPPRGAAPDTVSSQYHHRWKRDKAMIFIYKCLSLWC